MNKHNATYDKIAFQYDQIRGGEERGRLFANEIMPFLNSDERVLEMGIGTGLIGSVVDAAGYNFIGLDLSKEMLKKAAGRVKHLIWGDMRELPFISEHFGSVYSVFAFHLSLDVPSTLKEVRRVLKPGGLFINCSPINRDLDPNIDDTDKIVWRVAEQISGDELILDTPEQMIEYASSCGFQFLRTVNIERPYVTSTDEIISMLEGKGMTFLQEATAEQYRNVIAPAIVELRNLGNQTFNKTYRHQLCILQAI